MKNRFLKLSVGLGVGILVGCAAPLSNPVPPPARIVRPPVPDTSMTDLQAPVQPVAPAAGETSPLPDDQAQAPRVADEPWTQRGLASWYGKRFNGRRTASGERFKASGLTAAHRTLPIPSYVRVRRVASGEEVIVRINDRGPYHSARVIDLSLAAAKKLGFVALGSAEVEIELLSAKPIAQDDKK